ncbi:MAG: ATP phosphoribosyltransferase [Alphaproteobacteria bacterium]
MGCFALSPLTIAVPKGRIARELMPLLSMAGIEAEPAFYDEHSRQLMFATQHPHVRLVRVRSFDVATFVAFGGAQIGVCGSDVLMEFNYSEIYAPLHLNIGHCRLSLAAPSGVGAVGNGASHVRVATKYPHLTANFFANKGIQAECVKLNGAMEIAPLLGLCHYIVDLVSTGSTLKANGLEEVEIIADISSRLVVNRSASKTRSHEVHGWVAKFTDVCQQLSIRG